MQFSPEQELVFSEPGDQDLLYGIRKLFEKNEPFDGVSFDEYVLRLQADLYSRTGSDAYAGPVSAEELGDDIRETEIAWMEAHGLATALNTADTAVGAFMRLTVVLDKDVEYRLPPKWTPVILAGAMILTGTMRRHEDELVQLMVDGTSEGHEAANRVTAALCEENGIDSLTADEQLAISADMAQDDFDRARHALAVVMALGRHFGGISEQ